MAVIRIQTCEMCGRKRDLGKHDSEERDGWRKLEAGTKEATLCILCVSTIVGHALERSRARNNGHAGSLNDRPFTVSFAEYGA